MTRRYKEGILPFKIVPCNEPLVARSRLVLPYEMAKALRLPRVMDEEFPGQVVVMAINPPNLSCL
jgi:hypothetical protein